MLPQFARRHSQVIRQETARRPSQVQAPRLLDFISIPLGSFLLSVQRKLFPRKPVQRKLICFALAFNLLLWPGPGLASQHILGLAWRALDVRVGFNSSYEAYFLSSLFSQSASVTQHETMADRASAVARIRLNPVKFVGYVDETITFTALATDFLDRTIQGVKFTWDESDRANKLQIDDAGSATFLHPGLARITCRAGSVEATAAVLIRPNHRPVQSDPEWRADQASLSVTGNTTGESSQPGPTFFSSLLDSLALTAYAQGGSYTGSDFVYDQLWSEPRNLVGSPPNRTIEPTALGNVQPEGSNFDLAIPLVSLGGRGLAASLMLNYNSRLWGRHGNAVTFDPVASWPTPGFSLGFGRIVTYDINYSTYVSKFLLVEPDGTRRYLGASNTWFTGQTSDGSHVIYSGGSNGGFLCRPDGTVTYFANVNNRLLPTSIRDSNGNFIVIAYKPAVDEYGFPTVYPPQAIDYVTDTLGRIIQFYYDASGRVIKITAPGFGGTTQNPVTQTVAQFDYQTRALGYSFSGLAVENAGAGVFDALRHVYFPATGTGYLFTYSGYGMIYNYSVRRQMSISGSAISDGVESAAVSFNYPTSGVLTDAPAFTQRTETAVNSPTGVYTYSKADYSTSVAFAVARPDGSTLYMTRIKDASSVGDGRMQYREILSGGHSYGYIWLAYVNDAGGSPQVQSAFSADDLGQQSLTNFDYDAYGNITNKREYGYQIGGAWQVRRRTHFTYSSSYLNGYTGGQSWMPGLVTLVELFDALQNTNDADDVLIAKSSYACDNYVAMGGMENYGGTANPPGHFSSYDQNWTARGNVTGVTEWTDLAAGTTIQHLAKLDIFGSVVTAQVSCCQEKDLTNTLNTYWSQPESEMSGDPNGVHQSTSADYDFNTSLANWAKDAGGLTTTYGYDAALNPSTVSLPTGASANTGYSYGNLSSSSSVYYDDGGVAKTLTTTAQYDGWGRVIQSVDRNNGQVNTSYDAIGRVISRTNPFTAGGTPGPATTFQYDALGRATITTLPGGNTVQNTYSGATVTATDQVNRKIQRVSDGLGRLVTVNEQDATGALIQATTYSYNYLDKLTGVNQGGQLRSYKYDAMGRLLYEQIPEQSATINDGTGTMWSCKYTYTEFSAVATRQDARGVVTSYIYDSLHRVGGVSYNTSGAPGVAATDPVSFGYSSWGAVSNVTVGNGYSENYTFDSNLRPASVTRTIQGHAYSGGYTTSYQYNGGSQLTQMTYPSGNVVGVSYDSRGRMSAEGNAVSGLSYNAAGQVTGLTLSYGVAESFVYDANRMQLTSQIATKSGGTTGGLMNLTYNYLASAGQMGAGSTTGNAGQLMSINNNSTINGTAESAAYTYDNLGRLVTSNQTSNGAAAQRRFAYDRWGNRTGVWDSTSGGNQIQSVALQQSGGAPTNRLTSVITSGVTANYTYDAAGNVTNDGVHSYTFDAENRVVSVDGGATAQYRYDHQNRRVTKIIGAAWTHYIWEGSLVIGEHDGTTPFGGYGSTPYGERSSQVDYIYAGSKLVSRLSYTHTCHNDGAAIVCTTASTTRYYLSDRLSTRLVLDASGNVLGRQGHLPFGEDFGESGSQEKHHFTNYDSDGESGTDYAVNRQYSQSLGRFNRPDPLASTGKKESPQTWNRYAYTRGDPLNLKDPFGLFDGFPDDPCAPFGAGLIIDGFEFSRDMLCFELAAAPLLLDPDPDPEPLPTPCRINIWTGGPKHSSIDTRSAINPANLDMLGQYENPVSDGWWFLIFEVQIFLGAPGLDGWSFNQSQVTNADLLVDLGGVLTPIHYHSEDPHDGNLAESPTFSQLVGSVYYWLDEPGRRKVHVFGGGLPTSPVVGGVVTWDFVMTATNTKDPRRSCSKRMQLKLSIGSPVKWKPTIS